MGQYLGKYYKVRQLYYKVGHTLSQSKAVSRKADQQLLESGAGNLVSSKRLYYKVGQSLLQSRAASSYYKVGQELLQSGAIVIKKRGNFIMGRDDQVGQSLQSMAIHLRDTRTNGFS